jgi:hypothetical protein
MTSHNACTIASSTWLPEASPFDDTANTGRRAAGITQSRVTDSSGTHAAAPAPRSQPSIHV